MRALSAEAGNLVALCSLAVRTSQASSSNGGAVTVETRKPDVASYLSRRELAMLSDSDGMPCAKRELCEQPRRTCSPPRSWGDRRATRAPSRGGAGTCPPGRGQARAPDQSKTNLFDHHKFLWSQNTNNRGLDLPMRTCIEFGKIQRKKMQTEQQRTFAWNSTFGGASASACACFRLRHARQHVT